MSTRVAPLLQTLREPPLQSQLLFLAQSIITYIYMQTSYKEKSAIPSNLQRLDVNKEQLPFAHNVKRPFKIPGRYNNACVLCI
jgi:hypothetical protein